MPADWKDNLKVKQQLLECQEDNSTFHKCNIIVVTSTHEMQLIAWLT